MGTGAASGSIIPTDSAGQVVHTEYEDAQQQEQHQQQQLQEEHQQQQQQNTGLQHAWQEQLGRRNVQAVTGDGPAVAAGDATADVGEHHLDTALHSLAAAAAAAGNDSYLQQQQSEQRPRHPAAAAPALEPPARKAKRMRSLNDDFVPGAGTARAGMQLPRPSDVSASLLTLEESTAAMSAAAAAAAAAMAATAEAMRRSGSVEGSRSLQQLGGWDATPLPPPSAAAAAVAGHNAAAAAASQQQQQQQHWKRTRYDDVNLQQLTPQQQHFYQAQQFHLRQQQQQQQQQQQGFGMPEGDPAEVAAGHTQQQQQQQDDVSEVDALAAAAAAAVAGVAGDQSGAAPEALQQSLHNRLQQLLLPELGRQAILQSLDPATQCMVECGSATGIFSVDSERILCLCSSCSEGKGPPGPDFMPSEFERHGGMAACKKWRFSIKVADGGPGMTLGRWLDMRGIQINSYPAKSRQSVSRGKRPLDTGKGLVSAGGSAGSGGTGGTTIQLDVSQLLAGLISGNSHLTGALKSAMNGAAPPAASTGATAAAATGSAGRNTPPTVAGGSGSSSGGAADASAGGAARLNELAAAVADMLVKELPAAAAAAAAGAPGSTAAAGTSMAAGHGSWIEEMAITAQQPGLPHASAAAAATCMWPETAVATGRGPEDVPPGYAIAAQVASGLAGSPGLQQLQQLQQQHSTLASALNSVVAGQGGPLSMTPSTGSATNVLRLPGPGQLQGMISGRGSMLTGSQDQLPPLHSGHSMQNSSTAAMMQMLQRHQQAAGQLHSSQLTPEQQRYMGTMQPAVVGAADMSPNSAAAGTAAGAAAGSSVQAEMWMQQPAGPGLAGPTAAAGLQGLGSLDSVRNAAAAAASWGQPPQAQRDSSNAPGASRVAPVALAHHHPQQQPGLGGGSAGGRDGGPAIHRAAPTATVNSGGSGGNAAPAAAAQGTDGSWSAPGVPASTSGGAGAVLGEFVTGPGSSAEPGSYRSKPTSQPGMLGPFSSTDAEQQGQGTGLLHLAAAAVPGTGAMDAVESLRSWVTQGATAVAGGAAAAAPAPVRMQSGVSDPGPASTPSADFKKLVGSVESRLDGLLQDRRRRKQLEEQLIAQGALLARLQAELAAERCARLAAEQQLAALSALLSDKLDDDAPAQDAAAAAAAAAAPWAAGDAPGSVSAGGQLHLTAGQGGAHAEPAGGSAADGSGSGSPRAVQAVQTAATGRAQSQSGDAGAGRTSAEGSASGLAGGAAVAATPPASAAAAATVGPGLETVANETATPVSAAAEPRRPPFAQQPALGVQTAVKQEAAAAEQQLPQQQGQNTFKRSAAQDR